MTTSTLAAMRWRCFEGMPVVALVTGRDGGVSTGPYESLNLGLHVGDDPENVVENRRRAAAALGLALEDMVFCHQTHGRDVAVVDGRHRGRGTTRTEDALPADALVTATPDVGLAVLVADCVPIVLYDPKAHVLGTVHAGWKDDAAHRRRGRGDGRSRRRAGPDRRRIAPVTADRYQVGDDVADAARDCFGDDVDGVLRPDGTGRWLLDLWAANRRVLAEAGVDPANVEVGPVGTGPGTPFFSDRAERPCGRFAALARLRPHLV